MAIDRTAIGGPNIRADASATTVTGRDPDSAAFEPIRIATGTRRVAWVVCGWLVALVSIAGIAALSVPAEGERSVGPFAIATPGAIASSTGVPRMPIARLSIVEARSFDRQAGTSTRRLEVSGQLLVRADRIRVTLEGREDRILETIVRRPIWLAPPTTPRVVPAFAAAFELPAWRSGGMWVTVVAFDERGDRIGRVRERVEVYPLPGATSGRTR